MKKLFLSTLSTFILSTALATPFFYQGFISTGVTNTDVLGVSVFPRTDQPYIVYGTNIVFNGNILTITPNTLGYSSNWLFPGTYQFVDTNQNAAFIAVIPDTTNFLSLALYLTNVPVFSGVGLNSYGLLTNLLGFAPMTNNAAGVTNALAFIPANAANTNDFARATLAGITNSLAFIPANAANTNDFARASAAGITNNLGFIPANAANTNDFARATAAGITNALAFIPANAANSNDFARITADGLSLSISNLTNVKVITNGNIVFLAYKTNGVPGSAFTNYPQGSIMATTNGGFFGLSNLVWKAIEL